jgi:hypothetical protein
MRQDLVDRITTAVRDSFAGKLYCFGSFAAGLYLPTADMDLVLVTPTFERNGVPGFNVSYKNMMRVLKALTRANIAIERAPTTQIISKAKVPIIKFVDVKTQLHVDISFENLTGVVATGTFRAWQAQFPAMPVLLCILKQFLAMRNLNEVHSGGLGGFSITCLVVSFLQHHPDVQSGNMDQEQHLGQLLMEFLDLYGNKFNMRDNQIRMSPPGYGPKQTEVGYLLGLNQRRPLTLHSIIEMAVQGRRTSGPLLTPTILRMTFQRDPGKPHLLQRRSPRHFQSCGTTWISWKRRRPPVAGDKAFLAPSSAATIRPSNDSGPCYFPWSRNGVEVSGLALYPYVTGPDEPCTIMMKMNTPAAFTRHEAPFAY